MYAVHQASRVVSMVFAAIMLSTPSVCAQGFKDAAVIFYEAVMGHTDWIYDHGLDLSKDEVVLSRNDEFFVYGSTNLGAETVLSIPDEKECVIQVLKRVNPATFNKDAAALNAYFRTAIPPNVIERMKYFQTRETFFLNNVLSNEIQTKETFGQNLLGEPMLGYKFSLTGLDDLVCTELVKFEIDGNSLRFQVKEGHEPRRCERDLELSVPDNKIDRFKKVLTFLYSTACHGAKRSGKF